MEVLYQFLNKLVTELLNPIILLLAAAAFVVFVWGVFQYIRQAGDAKAREVGNKAIAWGLVGLVIIFGAYGILNIALKTFNLDEVKRGTLTKPPQK